MLQEHFRLAKSQTKFSVTIHFPKRPEILGYWWFKKSEKIDEH